MSLLIKKKQILAATLVIALVAATGVNWYYSQYMTEGNITDTTTEKVSGNLGDSLLVAGTTAPSIETTEETTAVSLDSDKYFTEARLKRTETEDEVIDNIEDILESPNLEASSKGEITRLLTEYTANLKAQTDAENLIKAKTGSECIVIISDGKCQVILEKNTLNDTVILQITEIIEKNTHISAENLTIIEIK